ncbi:hypothetical protein TGAM01_v204673 [Trichoderma gamsii]|uniref:Zn(2)-C6 fungal-type domain-containing protein n=1 Tax=Trichoderma gamsii TaxID=398673 RepID=A0A2P4ZQW6_9HYPO|nr:hypothetical protein TGAM01_v204673 [Trichoderma gamsii]PON26663.1 hypothetical protein TGAM01_v204673 [Trichoderma gamsii]
MSKKEPATVKKRRAKSSKSRRGCYTCKVRRVKCDETKPICVRCGKTGRLCEGFGYSKPLLNHQDHRADHLSPISSRTFQTKDEYRHFEYFRHHALLYLTGFDNQSRFWNETVLQLSEASPAVLHAVLALSALYEHLDGSSKGELAPDKLALQHYNRSIKHLRQAPSSHPIEFALTSCILFIAFESARDDHKMALFHLQNGLSIMNDWRTKEVKSFESCQTREDISEMLRRLDMQATTFLNSRQPYLAATVDVELLDNNSGSSMLFSSLRSAQLSLDKIEIRLFYILTTKSSTMQLPWAGFSNCATSRQVLLQGIKARFAQWKKAFDDFSEHEANNMNARDLKLLLLLELHYQTTSLMLDLQGDISSVSSSSNAQCTRINELSKNLILASSNPKSTFLVDTGIIAPLYFAATTTSCVFIRQQSLDLLRSITWKEGLWDSRIVVQIAEHLSVVGKSGLVRTAVSGGVPELADMFLLAPDPARRSRF